MGQLTWPVECGLCLMADMLRSLRLGSIIWLKFNAFIGSPHPQPLSQVGRGEPECKRSFLIPLVGLPKVSLVKLTPLAIIKFLFLRNENLIILMIRLPLP